MQRRRYEHTTGMPRSFRSFLGQEGAQNEREHTAFQLGKVSESTKMSDEQGARVPQDSKLKKVYLGEALRVKNARMDL